MSLRTRYSTQADRRIDPRLEEALRLAVAVGVVLMLLVPAARGSHAAIGWLPLWLLGMPLTAWWALHRFRLPTRARASTVVRRTRRRPTAQARRLQRRSSRADLPHAA